MNISFQAGTFEARVRAALEVRPTVGAPADAGATIVAIRRQRGATVVELADQGIAESFRELHVDGHWPTVLSDLHVRVY